MVLFLTLAVACGPSESTGSTIPPLPQTFTSQPPTDGPTAQTGCRLLVGEGEGAEVMGFVEGTQAGEFLQEGDVIVSVDQRLIRQASDLAATAAEHQIGDTIELTVRREDQEIRVEVPLGENPTESGRAMIGVIIRTRYQSTDPSTAEPGVAEGALVRVVHLVEEGMFLFDPANRSWGLLSEKEPTSSWTALQGRVYQLASEDSQVVSLVDDHRTPLATDPWRPARVVAALGDELMVAGSREPGPESALLSIDPSSGRTVWSWVPTPVSDPADSPLAQPDTLAALANPSQDRLLAAFLLGDEATTISYGLLDPTGRELSGWGTERQLIPDPGGLVHGWFDNRVLIYSYINTDFGPAGLHLYDTEAGTSTPLPLEANFGVITQLVPVGDGRNLLLETAERILLVDTETEAEDRPIAEGCQASYTDPGWEAP